MIVRIIKAHSVTHKLRSKGINFRKIRSEMKAIIAVKKHKPVIKACIPFCTGRFCPLSNKSITPVTRQAAHTIFNGVSLKLKIF